MTEKHCSPDIVERLRERARFAREEKTGTALGDALHFEEAVAEIEKLRTTAGNAPVTYGDSVEFEEFEEFELVDTPAQGAPEAPGYRFGLTYGDGYKRGFDDARGAPQAAEERRCQKCGRETKGEEALVDGKILCHPCADDVPQASTDKTLAQALYEAECYGIGATSDTNQRVILQAAKELAALHTPPQAAHRDAIEQIAVVCTDNMDADCNHRMALDFVRQIANDALSRPQRSEDR